MRTVLYQRADGKWDIRVVADNGRTLLNSDQGYENKQDALDMAAMTLREEVFGHLEFDRTGYPPANEGSEQV